VILHFEGHEALVKGDLQEQRVHIAVKGPGAGARRLLAIVRSDLERIHADIKNLGAHAVVPLANNSRAGIAYEELLTLERV